MRGTATSARASRLRLIDGLHLFMIAGNRQESLERAPTPSTKSATGEASSTSAASKSRTG